LYVHHAETERVNATERDRLHVLADFVANDIQGNLITVNHVEEGVIQDFFGMPDGPATPESSKFLTLRLKALEGAIPGLRALLVLDAQGLVTHSSKESLANLSLNYRDYFKQVREHPDKTTFFISPPFQSLKKEPDLVITASRMVPGAKGEFAGMVVAVLDRDYFADSFTMVLYAPDVWAHVVHGDGQQLMNFPQKKNSIDGTDLNRPGTLFRQHIESGKIDSIITGRSYSSGEYRLMSQRTILPTALHMDNPLVVGLSREVDAIALPLRRQAIAFGIFYAAIVLVCCATLPWMQTRRARVDALAAELERGRREAEQDKRLRFVERESEQRFRTLIEDAPLAVAMLRNGHFVYTNPRYRDLHGYSIGDDLSGMPWSAMISPESRAALFEQEAMILADSPIEQKFEAQGLGKEGRPVPVFKTTTRVELIDGPATLIFAQDISAQKNAENALLQARDAAEAASRSKADFLANMSHEIRSPLNAILGMAYLLEQAQLNFDAHSMVRKIRASGRMLLGIINDILDVSKIEAGHMALERAPFRLGDVIDNLAAAMGIAVGDKDIQLIIQPAPVGISSLIGDALRLEQVLSNLTSNAIKFTHEGRVELRIAVVSRDLDNVVLRFSVLDTGIGIAPELQGEVFSAFAQADTSTTRRFGGTGLGLTICRRLVSLMGGEIGLSSPPGRGSEFWFTLPVQLIADTDFSSPDMVHVEALIADDSEIALKAIGNIALSLGWQVNTVASGEAVLDQLRQRRGGSLPNIVILDWKMPGMDGLATARAIREALTDDECPIVIMATAHSLAHMTSEPGAELVDAVLSKPVTASALYNATVEAQRRRASAVGASDALQHAQNQSLEGVHVLVVDDSEINRDVAQRILQMQGATVVQAVDGKDALDWLLAHPDAVDLVLMDVQMPVMDGIEATRQLRQLRQFDDLPIVALTAGAFTSQQEAARAAGMTHFISKPFDVPTTIALIQRLRRNRAPGSADASRDAARPDTAVPDEHSPIAASADSSVINIQKGLHIWSDIDTYRLYLQSFAAGYGNAVETINANLAANDRVGAAALVHKLAGVAGNMSLPDTHRLALEAERVLTTEYDPTYVLGRLDDALKQVIAVIGRFAPRPTGEHAAPISESAAIAGDLSPTRRAELQPLFAALLAALDTDNPTPVEPIVAALSERLALKELADIRDIVRAFDFRGAEAATIDLAAKLGITLEGNP
jgi:PAS domain S-box-containing protein